MKKNKQNSLPLKTATRSIDDENGSAEMFALMPGTFQFYSVKNFLQLSGRMPLQNEVFFLWSIKQFNTFSIIMAVVKTFGSIDYLAVSSYNISKSIVEYLAMMVRDGHIGKADVYISNVSKSHFTPGFDVLKENAKSIENLNAHFVWNHSKIALMKTGNNYFVCEGSGNFSNNAQHEQYVFVNSQKVFDFRMANFSSMELF